MVFKLFLCLFVQFAIVSVYNLYGGGGAVGVGVCCVCTFNFIFISFYFPIRIINQSILLVLLGYFADSRAYTYVCAQWCIHK
jgi:hypothetical protein